MNVLTIIVCVYLLVAMVMGYQRGAVRMILALLGTVVTLILTAFLTPAVAAVLKQNTSLQTTIYEGVDRYIGSALEESLEESLEDSLPEDSQLLEQLPLPQEWLKWLENNNTQEQYEILGVDNFVDYVNRMTTNFIFNCICFAFVFVVIKLVISVLLLVLNGITALPLIHQMNGLAGVAIALVESLIMLWCLCLVVSAFGTSDLGSYFMQQIQESALLQLIYNHNPIMNFFVG